MSAASDYLLYIHPRGCVLSAAGMESQVCRTALEIDHFMELSNGGAHYLASGLVDGRIQTLWVHAEVKELPFTAAVESCASTLPDNVRLAVRAHTDESSIAHFAADLETTPDKLSAALGNLATHFVLPPKRGSLDPNHTLPVRAIAARWSQRKDLVPSFKPPQLVDISAFNESELPPREWIIPGMLMRATVTTVAAKGGTAKSTFTLHVGMMVCTGMEWAYWEVVRGQSGKVLMLSSEDNLNEMRRRRIVRRTRRGRPSFSHPVVLLEQRPAAP